MAKFKNIYIRGVQTFSSHSFFCENTVFKLLMTKKQWL